MRVQDVDEHGVALLSHLRLCPHASVDELSSNVVLPRWRAEAPLRVVRQENLMLPWMDVTRSREAWVGGGTAPRLTLAVAKPFARLWLSARCLDEVESFLRGLADRGKPGQEATETGVAVDPRWAGPSLAPHRSASRESGAPSNLARNHLPGYGAAC